MSDRSYMTATVYAAPAELHEQIHALLDEYLDGETCDPLGDTLVLGQAASVEEVYIGAVSDLANALCELTSDVAFKICQDGRYEYSGLIYMHTPELGLYCASVTNEGDVAISQSEVLAALDAGPVEQAGDRVRRLYGQPWRDALAAL